MTLEEIEKEIGRQEAERWRENAITALREEASRVSYDVDAIVESFSDPQWNGTSWVFEVRHSASLYLEVGTEPHIITPDGAEALRFVVDGEEVFAQSVEHPGLPALKFLNKARQRTARRGESR